MEQFLYDRDLCHERVEEKTYFHSVNICFVNMYRKNIDIVQVKTKIKN